MFGTTIYDRIDPDNEEEIFTDDVSDDLVERVADVERLDAITLAFCSGLDTCPS
jgi:hypothetical protein